MDLAQTPKANVPKLVTESLEVKSNFYVIKKGASYNYFPIKIQPLEDGAEIMRLEKWPPVIMEGVIIISRKLYRVTPADLQRGVIRKSREIVIAKRGKTNGSSANSDAVRSVPAAVRSKDQQGASTEAELEIGEAADAAWEDQVGALLDYIAEKEGFELEENPAQS